MIKISPTNTIDESKDESYTLEDKDFLLITAIRDLTKEIERTRIQNGR